MALAWDRETGRAGRFVPAVVITLAARGAGGQPVLAVRRGHHGLIRVGVALTRHERAGGEVQCEESEQHGEADQPMPYLSVTDSPPAASHGQNSRAGTRVNR